jgi:hypothetical protein
VVIFHLARKVVDLVLWQNPPFEDLVLGNPKSLNRPYRYFFPGREYPLFSTCCILDTDTAFVFGDGKAIVNGWQICGRSDM